ncbi:hypothetical protein Tco_0520959 [Tanacetum coccineum]
MDITVVTLVGEQMSPWKDYELKERGFELEDSKMGRKGAEFTRTPRIRASGLQGLDSFSRTQTLEAKKVLLDPCGAAASLEEQEEIWLLF